MSDSSKTGYIPPLSEDLASKHIQHFMTTKVVTASPSITLKNAINTMLSKQISALPIVDGRGRCIGVFSEFDAMLQGASGSLDEPIKYTKMPITVKNTSRFRDALILLISKRVKRLPVVDDHGLLIGVISRRDFMKAIYGNQK